KERVLAGHEPPSLKWTEILSKEQVDAVLKRWKKLRAIEVAYAKQEDAPAFVPQGADGDPLGLLTVRYAFERKTTVNDAVAYVKSLWGDKEVEKAETVRVDGIDEWGVNRRVELDEKIPSLFGDLDHDEIIAETTTFDPELKKSYVIRELRE